ncbi:MAG: hypothetical protein K9K82_10115 [Desulfobacteraceae bacterium]|nr:hypothetical protein [Desulfobacteraceae bacterium]
MKEIFQIEGSIGDSYKIEYIKENGQVIIKCNCPAGKFGKFCKHKMRFIQGDTEILADEDQDERLSEIADQIQKSEYLNLIIAHSKAKRAVEEAEQNLKDVRKKIAKAMKNGL